MEDMTLKWEVEIASSIIESCQWLPSKEPKRFVVKFSKRKDTKTIRKVKKNVMGINLSSTGVKSPVGILKKVKKNCVNKFIHLFWVSDGSIRLKLIDNERSFIITHINDLEELFPGNEILRNKNRLFIYYCVLFLDWVRWVEYEPSYTQKFSSHFFYST